MGDDVENCFPKEECTKLSGSGENLGDSNVSENLGESNDNESLDKSTAPQMALPHGLDSFQAMQNEVYENHTTDKPPELIESSGFKKDDDDDEGMKEESFEVKTEDEDPKPFGCDQCDYRSVSQHGLSNHKKKHMLPFNKNCEDCGENFRQVKMLVKHSNEQHGGRKCPDCPKRFAVSSSFNLHVRKHTGLVYGCNLCGKNFSSKLSLTTHTNIHLGLKPHKCSQCDKAFTDPTSKIRHERSHDNGGVEVFCPVCGKGFSRSANFKQHMKTHSNKKFSMEEKVEGVALAAKLGVREASDQLSVGLATLTNWVKMVTEPVYCTQCNYITYKVAKLAQHEKTFHSGEENATRMPRDFKLPEYQLRPFPCDRCPVRSKNKVALRKHMRRVHGEGRVASDMTTHGRYQEKKKHACPSCPKSYSSKYALSDHLKVCSGSNSILSNKTSDPDYMNEVATLAINSGVLVAARTYKISPSTVNYWMLNLENPGSHNCEVCGKQCVNYSVLARHIKKHHSDANGLLVDNSDSTKSDQWEDRPFVCEFCCQTFPTEAGLDKHRVCHMAKEDREEEEVKKVVVETLEGLKELYEAKYGKLGKEDIPSGASVGVTPKKEDQQLTESMVKEEVPDSDGGDCQDVMKSEGDDSDFSDSDDDMDGESPVNPGKLLNLKMEADEIEGGEIPFYMVKEEAPDYTNTFMPPLGSLPKKKYHLKPSVCIHCGKIFNGSSDLKKHVRDDHEEFKETFPCGQCPKVYQSRSARYMHRKADHEGVKHYCDKCERWFSRKNHLVEHMESEHEEKTFPCELCGKYYSRRGLTDHQRAVHRGNTFECPECQQTFTTLGNLTNHRKNKHEKIRYHCEQCVSSFTRSSDLNIHVKTKHEGMGSMFQCDLCEKSFASIKALRLHRAKHSQPTWPVPIIPPQNTHSEPMGESFLSSLGDSSLSAPAPGVTHPL